MATSIKDTTTELDAGDGGDLMDEAVVVQSDGVTEAKQPRVMVCFDSDDEQARIVRADQPLPTRDDLVVALLHQIAEDMREMKLAMLLALSR